MSEKKESEKPVETAEPEPEEEKEMCCCCLCQCSTEETKHLSCCACFPIKCGLVTIGIVYIILTVFLFTGQFYGIINEYIHWWYVLVCIFLMAPIIVGFCFFIFFFTKDDKASRGKLFVSCMLLMISFSLLAIWNILYFNFMYK